MILKVILTVSEQCYQPKHVVHGHDAVRPRGPRVVYDGRVALHPHPTTRLGQEPVVPGRHLPFR